MDFILFYSKYSDKCALLLREIPLLNDKAVSVDSPEGRSFLRGLPYPVKRVPTLFVTDGINKIIKVLEGLPDIRNWFLLVTYSMSTQPSEEVNEEEHIEPDDDMLPQDSTPPDGGDYVLKSSRIGDTRSLAEELQRERESFLESTAPPAAPGMGVTRI